MSLDSVGPTKAVPGSRMTHSLSTPSGVDGTATPHRGGKKLAIRIQMLDDSVTMFQVQVRFSSIFWYILLQLAVS